MKEAAYLAVVLTAAVALGACSPGNQHGNWRPTAPSTLMPNPPAPPPQMVNGEIAVGSLSPGPGAIVGVFDCDPTLPLAGSRPAHVIGFCTYELRMTFAVLVDRAIPDARLTVELRSGDRRCAFGMTGASLTAGNRTAMTAVEFVFSDDPRILQPCEFPATTDRVIVELVGLSAGGLLRQEFPYAYTFAVRE